MTAGAMKDWLDDWRINWKYRKPFWSIRLLIDSKILHIADHYGMRFNKPIRLFKRRYTVGLQTYYRKIWR